MSKRRGKTTGLQLRGKRVGEHLKARIQYWQSSKMSDHPDAFHKPGSNKR